MVYSIDLCRSPIENFDVTFVVCSICDLFNVLLQGSLRASMKAKSTIFNSIFSVLFVCKGQLTWQALQELFSFCTSSR